MRDEYIRLIKEYINLNPEYKHTLREIKASVISFGATEKEFDEAVRQITGLPYSSQSFAVPISYVKLSKDLLSKVSKGKKHLVITSLAIISTIVLIMAHFRSPASNISPLAKNTKNIQRNVKVNNQNAIPQVYANLQPIDVKKAFSFPQANIQLVVNNKPKKEVLGFFPYWMLPYADKINLGTFTSVSLFGLEVDGKGNIITSHAENQQDGGWAMWKDPNLARFIKIARGNGLKIFLTLKSFDNTNIENLVSSDSAQKTFISNALYLVNSKYLDGINLDFEYIGTPPDAVHEGFTHLVTNLNTELKRQIPNALLTIDTYITSGSELGLFDIPLLSKVSDAFVIMGYDMHYSLGSPGPISPMGGAVNIIGLVQGYLEKVSPEKLILALPYYAYDWPINSESSSATQSAEIISYAEVAEASKKYKLVWDDTSQTPSYTYNDKGTQHEVHFENVRSLGIKYDYIKTKGLKGIGIWALGYDGLNSDLQRLIVDKFSD